MKKSKSWIHVCVHFLLFITLGVHSDRLHVNPVTDDLIKLSFLRQNIPKDYIIPVEYVPKKEAGMCWMRLNIFYLETSLEDLSQKFGNISSNKNDINIFIHILQELRVKMPHLDDIMFDFECHYKREGWDTNKYFDFVENLLTAAQNEEDSDECDVPPCPTSPYPPTESYSTESSNPSSNGPMCPTDCKASQTQRLLPEVVERSLLSLLFIPLLAIVFLLVWKLRSRRNQEDIEQNPAEDGLTGTEGTAPPLDTEISEKNMLNVIEIV
ncbi:kit ligand a [Archocentrus centrarchus]|uniref:kit ligand a n=1 Tax=Archocentrus centrarchus TaxID=63155 RepID=UPI0011EA074B|nr:kit ligand-like [Archocentrus centrarchus]